MKYLLAISTAALLLSSSAIAQEQWTKEEQAAGIKRVEHTRRVPASGKPRVLEDVTYLNADCSVIEDVETTVTKEPQHGSATIETSERYPSYPKDAVRSRCNDRKVKSQQLVYKPALNFTGDDQFEVQTLYANGQVVEYSYHVKVVGPSKGMLRILIVLSLPTELKSV